MASYIGAGGFGFCHRCRVVIDTTSPVAKAAA